MDHVSVGEGILRMGMLVRLAAMLLGIGTWLIVCKTVWEALAFFTQSIPQLGHGVSSCLGQFLMALACHPIENSLHEMGNALPMIQLAIFGILLGIAVVCTLALRYSD